MPNPSLKLSTNGVSRWPSGAGPLRPSLRQPPSAPHRWRQLSSNVRPRMETIAHCLNTARPSWLASETCPRFRTASASTPVAAFGGNTLPRTLQHSAASRCQNEFWRAKYLAGRARGANSDSYCLQVNFGRRSRSTPPARPNPSLNRTGYGRQRKPGLWHIVHHHSPGLRCLPPPAG